MTVQPVVCRQAPQVQCVDCTQGLYLLVSRECWDELI